VVFRIAYSGTIIIQYGITSNKMMTVILYFININTGKYPAIAVHISIFQLVIAYDINHRIAVVKFQNLYSLLLSITLLNTDI
jgi:hypothetical protein